MPTSNIAQLLIESSGEDNDSKNLRCHAAKTLGQIKSSESIPVLVKALEDNPHCLAETAEALGSFGPEAKMALPALEKLITEEEKQLKIFELVSIKMAIKQIGNEP